MPSTKGVSGSRTCQACTTNSCRLRRALSAVKRRRLKVGLLEEGIELRELFVVEFGVVDFILVYLMLKSEALSLGCEALAKILNRPRFLGARRLPQQFRRFLRRALRDERLVEGFVELCSVS